MARSTLARRGLAGAVGVGMALGVSPLLATPASAAHVTQVEFFSPFIDGATGTGTTISSKEDGAAADANTVHLLADAPPEVTSVTFSYQVGAAPAVPISAVDASRPFTAEFNTTLLDGPISLIAEGRDANDALISTDTESVTVNNTAETIHVALPVAPSSGSEIRRVGRFNGRVIVRGTTTGPADPAAYTIRDILGGDAGPAVSSGVSATPVIGAPDANGIRTFAANTPVVNTVAPDPAVAPDVAYLNALVVGESDETQLARLYEQVVADSSIVVTQLDVDSVTTRVTVTVRDVEGQPIAGVRIEQDADGNGTIESTEIKPTGVNGNVVYNFARPSTGTQTRDFTINSNQTTGFDPAIDFQRTVTLTAPAPGATAPSMPLNVNAAPGDGQVTVTWNPPADPGTSPIVDYLVTPSTGTPVVVPAASPRTVTFTGLQNGTEYTFTVIARSADGDSPPGTDTATPTAVTTPPAEPGDFTPILANRVYDSRLPPSTGQVGGGQGVLVDISGGSEGAVPVTATSVVLNITAALSPGNGHLVVWPSDATKPATSALNYKRAQTVSSSVVTRVGSDGNIRIAVGDLPACKACSPAHVIVDVQGYFSSTQAGGRYVAVTPDLDVTRYDSRNTGGPFDGRCPAGSPSEECADGDLFDMSGIPGAANANAVVVSLAVAAPSNAGYVQALSSDAPASAICDGGTANLSALAGQTRANLAVISLATDKTAVLIACRLQTHVIVDVVGFFTTAGGDRFVPTPTSNRIADTRRVGGPGAIGPDGRRTFDVSKDPEDTLLSGVPVGATHVVMTITGTAVSARTHFSIDERPLPRIGDPPSSFLNVAPGNDVGNTVIAPLVNGQFVLFNKAGNANAVIDVVGYFINPAP